jgi:cytoskeletal protein CcmA (bactofilin family)
MKLLFFQPDSFYISKYTVINGNISADRNGNIDGVINGDITIKGELTVERNGILNGDVHAKKIVVKGVIKGNVYCEGKVYACKNAEVHGNIFAEEAIIDKESLIKGAVTQIHQKTNANDDAKQQEQILETNIAVIVNKSLPDDPPQNWF